MDREKVSAGPPEFRRRGRIVDSLLLVLVLVGLAPLAAGLWRIIEINREALVTSTQESQLLLARSTAEKVDLTLEALEAEVRRVALMVGTDRGRPGLLLETLLDDRIRYAIYVGGSPATATAVGHVPDGLHEAIRQELREVRIRLATVSAGAEGAYLSRPFLGEHLRQTVFLLSVPTVDADGHPGVLSGVVDLTAIWNSVASGGGNVVYAIDDHGTVIATTNPVRIPIGQDVSGSTLVDRFLSADGRGSETLAFDHGRENGTHRWVLGSYAGSGRGWGIFVQAELDEVYAPIRHMIATTLTSAVLVMVVAATGAVLFALQLSKPIRRLAEASRAYARGDFSTRVRVRTRNEIGELAATFNGMASDIEAHIADLRSAATEQQELFEGTILALAEAIDAKDNYTRGHSARVNRYSLALAAELGLTEQQTQDVHVASLLHDVGKIGIDDAILKKAGTLTAEEYEQIKEHAARGAAIMSRIPQMDRILPGLRWHHERMDGTGYPDGLHGEQIPLIARIIAVADTFDAVTSDRSYQETRTFDEGLRLLHDLIGELDPRVVAAFASAYDRGDIAAAAELPPLALAAAT